ncbi:GntR family transcriptional regulator [Chakrabartyella piscis]|uniref:GntR family transcriptional regulator n=1 Tax=Chakrabartyella piscis TaxID=2918914 RepID=UPI00295843EC|nr:GntR family transcriptional regulator [Chakrabartyella piscis]
MGILELELPKSGRQDTVTNMVYSVIRKAILDMSLEPGETLSEKEIAAQFAVSKTPVRESFIRLAREGLLDIYPQRGTYVSKISISRCKEERFLREALEKATFEGYMEHPSEESLQKLQDCIRIQKEVFPRGDAQLNMKYDDEFHDIFFDATGNGLSKTIIRSYAVNYQRTRLLSIKMQGNIGELNTSQHEELYQAIVEKNIDVAHDVLTTHVQKLFTELDEIVNAFPDYFID